MTLLNVLNVLNVLNIPKDPSLTCWAMLVILFHFHMITTSAVGKSMITKYGKAENANGGSVDKK